MMGKILELKILLLLIFQKLVTTKYDIMQVDLYTMIRQIFNYTSSHKYEKNLKSGT